MAGPTASAAVGSDATAGGVAAALELRPVAVPPPTRVAADGTPRWLLFGFGSLVWRPECGLRRVGVARVRGVVRRLWLASIDHRGTPAAPGRVVTLVPSPSPSPPPPPLSDCASGDGDDAAAGVVGVLYECDAVTMERLAIREAGGYTALPVSAEVVARDALSEDGGALVVGGQAAAWTFAADATSPFWVGPHVVWASASATMVAAAGSVDGGGVGGTGVAAAVAAGAGTAVALLAAPDGDGNGGCGGCAGAGAVRDVGASPSVAPGLACGGTAAADGSTLGTTGLGPSPVDAPASALAVDAVETAASGPPPSAGAGGGACAGCEACSRGGHTGGGRCARRPVGNAGGSCDASACRCGSGGAAGPDVAGPTSAQAGDGCGPADTAGAPWSVASIACVVASAVGPSGSNMEYVMRLRDALRLLGDWARDAYIEAVCTAAEAVRAAAPQACGTGLAATTVGMAVPSPAAPVSG